MNSRDYQITPWSNDPVTDPPGEGFYLRDPATGRVATPFCGLSSDTSAAYEVRHGLGKSVFRSDSGWVEVTAEQTLAEGAPAKLTRLIIRNPGTSPLELEVSAYAELVQGNNRERSAPMIQVHRAPNALVARNPYAMDYTGRATALGADRFTDGSLASRVEFLGNDGDMCLPQAVVSGWPGAKPGKAETENMSLPTRGSACAAIMCRVTVAPGQTSEVTFALADAPAEEIADVLTHALGAGVGAAITAQAVEWENLLSTLQVETPDEKLNLLVNAWLPYQALACRIRARSGFYQASGAFGFRDQLQDTSALILHDPMLARRQILTAASRQFPEGDVQHWWLPATGAGVRTMISDDVVWLAHSTARYVEMTADAAILDEVVDFIAGPALASGQHDAFFTPDLGGSASLFDHCARALDLAIARTGQDGLPLILGGDWNDGMNRVGEGGRGQSVWLGWFLGLTLDQFAPLAEARGDTARA